MRLIDADSLIDDVDGNLTDAVAEKIAIEKIKNTPTIDAVPVVRCKDCKYSKPIACKHYVTCTYGEPYESCSQESDWFCAYGERREE